LKSSSTVAHRRIVRKDISEKLIEKISFSTGKTRKTAAMPAKKAKLILVRGSGWSQSSFRQNQSQSKAGITPPKREVKMVARG
jgi:hypothetical protein